MFYGPDTTSIQNGDLLNVNTKAKSVFGIKNH